MAEPVPLQVPIKIVSKIAGTTLLSRARKYLSFLFIAYILKGLVPYIHKIDVGYALQHTVLQKIWFLLSTFMHIFAQRIWLSDINVLKYMNEIKAGSLSGISIIMVRIELIIAILIIYKALFGLTIPIIHRDISLKAFICWWLNYEEYRAGLTFQLMLIGLIMAPWLMVMADSSHIAHYYPFKGIYTFAHTIITNPQLFFNIKI